MANSATQTKTVASPNTAFDKYVALWQKSRAVCSGERFVKEYDRLVDPTFTRNLLIPFSPSMTPEQFSLYKAEAELPGITAQFKKMLVGGLLRKQPILTLPDEVAKLAYDWIMNEFGQDESPLSSFLESILDEELQTSRSWIYVDYPKVENAENQAASDKKDLKPYPVMWQAEKVINWRTKQEATGKVMLDRIITRELIENFVENEFHPVYVDQVKVHELVNGNYQVRIYERESMKQDNLDKKPDNNITAFVLKETITNILVNGQNLTFIPAWPLNGSVEILEPMLMPIIDKEISLYNKLSRRNHLLYGAATYTPVITGPISREEFEEIVGAGLGSWIRLPEGSTATVLDTPTAALADMDRAIAAAIEEMAKLGIRMLTPEVDQSGIALQIRNAAQTAQLGSLNNRISNIFCQVIAFMINWRFETDLKATAVEFSLSADFTTTPLGADWLRLATEWYQQGLIPRSVWLILLKQNEMLPSDYDDKAGKKEIDEEGMEKVTDNLNLTYAEQLGATKLGLVPNDQSQQTGQE